MTSASGWSPALDALIREGVEAGHSWASVADALTAASGAFVSPESARSRWNRVRRQEEREHARAGLKALGQAVEYSERERQEERATVRNLRAEVADLAAQNKDLTAMLALYKGASEEPIRVPDWRIPSRATSGKHVGTVMASLADWHLDEVVRPEQVLGLNQYNRRIAERRMQKWMEKVVTLPREYVNGLDIEGLIVPATGDLFTGEIHAELKETNEDKVLSSLLYWMEPIIAMVETLGSEYRAVEIDCVPGNHTRITEKYNHKDRVKESLEQFFWAVVRARIRDRGKAPNVTINISPSSNMNLEVYGRNHVLDHGYEFKGGTGISGAFAPLSLGAHRKNVRQSVAGLPMHTMVIGHMHQIINIPGVIMGGTLKGYDEYAFDLNLRPDENGAGQALWITAPERAQVLWMPVYVQDNEAERALL